MPNIEGVIRLLATEPIRTPNHVSNRLVMRTGTVSSSTAFNKINLKLKIKLSMNCMLIDRYNKVTRLALQQFKHAFLVCRSSAYRSDFGSLVLRPVLSLNRSESTVLVRYL